MGRQQQVAPDIPATVWPIALQQHSGGRGQATWALICPTVWILALCLIVLNFALDILTVSFQSSNCYWKSREQGCEHTVGRQKIQNQKNECWAIINRTKYLQNSKQSKQVFNIHNCSRSVTVKPVGMRAKRPLASRHFQYTKPYFNMKYFQYAKAYFKSR